MGTNETTDIHASYLHWVEEASAYRLAELADCGAPDSKLSPGAEILGEVRDAVVKAWRAGRFDYDTDRNDYDVAMECAEEGIIPPASHEIVALFVDLAAWAEESEFTEKGEWSGSFTDMFKDAISQITERAAFAFITEVRSDFDQHFQCPECGDTGTPHICYPGDCRGSDEDKATHAASLAAPLPIRTPGLAMQLVNQSDADAPVSAVLTGPVDLPAEPVRDPLLDIITAHELRTHNTWLVDKASPGDETAAFMARMEAVNAAEFARVRPWGHWANWVMMAGVTVALVVAWIIL